MAADRSSPAVATSPTPAPQARPGAAAPPSGQRAPVYILSGQLHVATAPTAITTVLGSCVSVCLYDLQAGVGGMNHYLLPTHVARDRGLRFGTVAIDALLAEVLARGAVRGRLQAKVFGGASVMGVPDGGRKLGDENVKVALRQLAALAVPVMDGDVGGTRGRKLVFHSDDGSAWVRLL